MYMIYSHGRHGFFIKVGHFGAQDADQEAIALLKALGKLRSTCRGLTPQRPFTVETCDKSCRRKRSKLGLGGGYKMAVQKQTDPQKRMVSLPALQLPLHGQ